VLFDKITTARFNFLKLLIVVGLCFPKAVPDNVVSNDLTITSSLRIDVIMLGINFLFCYDGSCQTLWNCVKVIQRKLFAFFSGHGVYLCAHWLV